jgi:hypothetical protein
VTLAGLVAGAAGCGAASPREADIYHDPALRPGVVPARAEAEEELLQRLDQVEEARTLSLAGERFEIEEPYYAASGRFCRAVRSGDRSPRLACRAGDRWVFVPQVVPTVEPAP